MNTTSFIDELTTKYEAEWDSANRAMEYAKVSMIETLLAEVYDILKQSTKSYNE